MISTTNTQSYRAEDSWIFGTFCKKNPQGEMMRSFTKLFAIVTIATTAAATAGAQGVTSATKPFSLGISGGASIPSGDLSSGTNTGYNVTGHVTLGSPTIPIAFRGDVGYNNWGAKGGVNNASVHTWNYTGNAVYEIQTPGAQIRPYLLGGIGAYKLGSGNSSGSYTSSNTDFGFDLGGGLTLPLSGFNAFVEAKYTQVNTSGSNLRFVPITVGVMF